MSAPTSTCVFVISKTPLQIKMTTHYLHDTCMHHDCESLCRDNGDKRFCVKHGGGLRCINEGCNKAVIHPYPRCWSHLNPNERLCKHPTCTRKYAMGRRFCHYHGGKRICKTAGCTQLQRFLNLELCRSCANIRCVHPGCNKNAITLKNQLCAKHKASAV